MNIPNLKVNLSKKTVKVFRAAVKDMLRLIDRKENEFLFPYLMNYTSKRKPTEFRLSKKNIKRLFNPDTYEVWYEMDGVVITPSFFRNPKALEDAITDREKGAVVNT